MSRAAVCACIVVILCSCGCASWEVPAAAPALPAPRMSPDSAILEIEFVPISDDPEEWNSVWNSVDEQDLPVSLRRDLTANGFRVGVLGPQLPMEVRELLEKSGSAGRDATQLAETGGVDAFSTYRQLPCRPGRDHKIITAPQIPDDTVLLINHENHVRAERFSQAQGVLLLRYRPLGDGQIRLTLTPVIEHGTVQQRFVPGQGSFRIDAGRNESELEQLSFDSTLGPGATLVVGSTHEKKGIGGWFFRSPESTTSAETHRLMLIRLVQTQSDELFSNESTRQPLATRLE